MCHSLFDLSRPIVAWSEDMHSRVNWNVIQLSIMSTFRQKAKYLKSIAQILLRSPYNGLVPGTMEDLVSLYTPSTPYHGTFACCIISLLGG
jgi:hypothetical protein